MFFNSVGGGESRNPSADNGDASQIIILGREALAQGAIWAGAAI